MEKDSYPATSKILVKECSFFSLSYHDIFEYPLTESELSRWSCGAGSRFAGEVTGGIEKTGRYYHLAHRRGIILLRLSREKWSRGKIKKAERIAKTLATLPTIKFIGITGSLAMNNAAEDSDIDLFIITKSGTLWSTRIMVRVIALLNGLSVRHVRGAETRDTICFNLWMDEENLEVPQGIRNIYTAHEVLQIVPLINKERTFEKFLVANSWARKYWPNVKVKKLLSYKVTKHSVARLLGSWVTWLLSLFESMAYRFQLWYMRNHRTCETVEPGRAFFHPIDWGGYVLRGFNKRVRKHTHFSAIYERLTV